MLATVFVAILLTCPINVISTKEFLKFRRAHIPNELTQDQVDHLSRLSNVTHINEILDNILIPRVVGTSNHEKVFKYITKQLRELDWNVQVDEFEERTPNFGLLKFKNIIASLNPNAERFLVLACHYDSKYFENEIFLGATDSAVPCAMMLNLVTILKEPLDSIRNNLDVSLKLIFFDGEEAFVQWGPNDSIYGAKHLANKMHQMQSTSRHTGELITDLDKIDVLVLLDLLGAKGSHFYSFFQETKGWYERLADAESSLRSIGALKGQQNTYFKRRSSPAHIEDDHIPFLIKDVPILHVIATPFPKVWHTIGDNRDIIDLNTVEDLNKIFAVFVTEYLHLPIGSVTVGEAARFQFTWNLPSRNYGVAALPSFCNWIFYYL